MAEKKKTVTKRQAPARQRPVAAAAKQVVAPLVAQPVAPLRLDLGCGKNKRDGFTGVDELSFEQVDVCANLGVTPWRFEPRPGRPTLPLRRDGTLPDDSVDEAHCSHFLEHLTWAQRVPFINELYRVLKPQAKCLLIIPHWNSARFYGDPDHKEPLSEWAFFYWDANWRRDNAPHTKYDCHFGVTYSYNLHPELVPRNQEYQLYALKFYKDAAQDVVATLTKQPMPEAPPAPVAAPR